LYKFCVHSSDHDGLEYFLPQATDKWNSNTFSKDQCLHLAGKLEITTTQTSRPMTAASVPPAFEVDKTNKDNAKSHIAAAKIDFISKL